MKAFIDGLVASVLLCLAVLVSVFMVWPLISTLVTIGLIGLIGGIYIGYRNR